MCNMLTTATKIALGKTLSAPEHLISEGFSFVCFFLTLTIPNCRTFQTVLSTRIELLFSFFKKWNALCKWIYFLTELKRCTFYAIPFTHREHNSAFYPLSILHDQGMGSASY